MRKYLVDSINTGNMIMNNLSLFSYDFRGLETLGESILYQFDWKYDDQKGYANIIFKENINKISDSSVLSTNTDSLHPFGRPLGLYNDGTLEAIFSIMMKNQGSAINGIYNQEK